MSELSRLIDNLINWQLEIGNRQLQVVFGNA